MFDFQVCVVTYLECLTAASASSRACRFLFDLFPSPSATRPDGRLISGTPDFMARWRHQRREWWRRGDTADAGGDDVETRSTQVVTTWRHGGRHRGNELVVDVVCGGCIMCAVMGMHYLVEDCGEVRGHGGEVVAVVARHKGTYITCWSEITINTLCPKINMYKLPNHLETVGIHIRINVEFLTFVEDINSCPCTVTAAITKFRIEMTSSSKGVKRNNGTLLLAIQL